MWGLKQDTQIFARQAVSHPGTVRGTAGGGRSAACLACCFWCPLVIVLLPSSALFANLLLGKASPLISSTKKRCLLFSIGHWASEIGVLCRELGTCKLPWRRWGRLVWLDTESAGVKIGFVPLTRAIYLSKRSLCPFQTPPK